MSDEIQTGHTRHTSQTLRQSTRWEPNSIAAFDTRRTCEGCVSFLFQYIHPPYKTRRVPLCLIPIELIGSVRTQGYNEAYKTVITAGYLDWDCCMRNGPCDRPRVPVGVDTLRN
jgi:hypothetical protein